MAQPRTVLDANGRVQEDKQPETAKYGREGHVNVSHNQTRRVLAALASSGSLDSTTTFFAYVDRPVHCGPPVMNGSFLRKTLFSMPEAGVESIPARSGISSPGDAGTHPGRNMREPLFRHQQPEGDAASGDQGLPADSMFLDSVQRARQSDSQRSRLGLGSRFLSPQAHDNEDGSTAFSMSHSAPSLRVSNVLSRSNAGLERSPHISEQPKLRPFAQSKPAKSLRQRLEPGSWAGGTLWSHTDTSA